MIITEHKLIEITQVEYLGDYRLRLSFSDCSIRDIDFAPLLRQSTHPEFRKYLDAELFKAYTFEDGELMWGDFDLIFPIADIYSGHIG